MTSRPDFRDQQKAWSSPPVDNVGYLSSAELLTLSDEALKNLVRNFEEVRYRGERNRDNIWRDTLGLDSTTNCDVLDYGCGTGVESLQYAKAGNRVWVADIAPTNVELACRVARIHGYTAKPLHIKGARPFIATSQRFDVIHCSGVLHHIPDPKPVMKRFSELLKPKGEVRLMLYSDIAWRKWTETDPPEEVSTHPEFERFVRAMDSVGAWADWYDRDRLERRFGDIFIVDKVEYMMADKTFLAATLRR